MRSSPHQRNIGWRVARRRLTVMSKVSGQVSIGPTGVVLQSKERISSAISPPPQIRERAWSAQDDGDLPVACKFTFRRYDRDLVIKVSENNAAHLVGCTTPANL